MRSRTFETRVPMTREAVLLALEKITCFAVMVQDRNKLTAAAGQREVGTFDEPKPGEPARFTIIDDGSMFFVRLARAALTFCKEVVKA